MADTLSRLSTRIGKIENEHEALCWHLLAAIHLVKGGSLDAIDALRKLASSLLSFATQSKKIVLFCQNLANVRDDVAGNFLVTHHVNSADHDMCPVLEDILVHKLGTIGMEDEKASEPQEFVGFDLSDVLLPVALNTADIIQYAAPLQGVIDIDRLGNAPVCIDAAANNVLKILNVLSYITQYSQFYRNIIMNAERKCELLTVKRVGQSTYSQVLFDSLSADLWVCTKLSGKMLVTMAKLIQSSSIIWKREVIDIIYKLYQFPVVPDNGNDENTQNNYLVALLEDMIANRYGTEKINNPTLDQMTPFMYLTIVNMRIQRALWQVRSGAAKLPESKFPSEWLSISAAPPYTLKDVFNEQKCDAFILESSHHALSCLVAKKVDCFVVINGLTGSMETITDGENLDASVFEILKSALWRAQCIHFTHEADAITKCTEATMRRLLFEADLKPVTLSVISADL